MGIPDYPVQHDGEHFRPFYDGLAAGELRISVDPESGAPLWYPPETVPGRPGAPLAWKTVSGEGSAYTFTTIVRSLLPGDHKAETPFTVVLFEPDDMPGVRVPGVLIGEGVEPGCGMRLRLRPIAVGGQVIAGFEPA
jgi:uncharacterized OB-fold protein